MWRGFWITSSERQIKTWVHDVPEQIGLENEIAGLDVVERVESQHVIYADYTIKEQESDSEGQLIPLAKGEKRYRFFMKTFRAIVKKYRSLRQAKSMFPHQWFPCLAFKGEMKFILRLPGQVEFSLFR